MVNKESLLKLIQDGNVEEFTSIISKSSGLIDLTESDFTGLTIDGFLFNNVDLSGSDFSVCEITQTKFIDSNLTAAAFLKSNINYTEFINSDLSGVKFNGSTVLECDFAESDLSGTYFIAADLTKSDFSLSQNIDLCIFDDDTVWPDPEFLPDDFDSTYSNDLSHLRDDDDGYASDSGYDY